MQNASQLNPVTSLDVVVAHSGASPHEWCIAGTEALVKETALAQLR